MSKLCIWLAPFSPDYSGVASVFFDLNTVTAMHDASGCTGNYTGYDEPRWYGSNSGIFCSGLQEIDAVLGDDEKLIDRMIRASESLHPDLMVTVGSPVPMVIGSDMKGIAHELEYRTGIPSFGFDTTGTAFYDYGISTALLALIDRFMEEKETQKGCVNIIGANAIDFPTKENISTLKKIITDAGYHIISSISLDYTLDDVKRAPSAEINLVVSRSGLKPAIEMKKRYGIPYLVGIPIGTKETGIYLEAMEQVIKTNEDKITNISTSCEKGKILILGEQVASNSIRKAISHQKNELPIVVGCIFGKENSLALAQDLDLKSESAIKKEMNQANYEFIFADPEFEILLSKESKAKFISVPHYGVSSKLSVNDTVHLIGSNADEWLIQNFK